MANRLREERLKNNLTLSELSKKLTAKNIKISSDGLAKYERGDREPKLATWKKLADYFGVPVTELMGMDNVSKVLVDMKKASNLINVTIDGSLSQQIERIESSNLSTNDKLVLSQSMALTMNIHKDYSKSGNSIVSSFDSIVDFLLMLSNSKDATNDNDRLEENKWFEKLKQDNLEKFDYLITTLYNDQVKEQNKKASD